MELFTSTSLEDAHAVLPLLLDLDAYYPGFKTWYVHKVIPEIVQEEALLVLAKEAGHIVGVSLSKKTQEETKLRCVRVLPAYQNRGVGIHLIDRSLTLLECEKPHCTVSEELLHTYSRVFVNRYGFALNQVDRGRYRPGKLEYAFN